MVVVFDIEPEVAQIGKGEEAPGKLHKQYDEDKLMNSVLEGDKETIEHAEMIQEAGNRGMGAFAPDMMFQNIVNNFSITRQLYGDKLISLLTGYDPRYIEKNAKIPEFKQQLAKAIAETVESMKDEGLLDDEGAITNRGTELASIALVRELDNIIPKDQMGEKTNKQTKHYGERANVRVYRKGDRYKDLNLRKTVHKAIRRGHKNVHASDLMTSEREGKGTINIILALDASASMKGAKLETCKKAGIGLAYKAIQEKDQVGLIVFGSEVKSAVAPTNDFSTLLKTISDIRASRQTDFSGMIMKSIELFPARDMTKHLIIITDALPTVGKEPERETLKAVASAKAAGITTSIIGIKLDNPGTELAKQVVQIGEGRLSFTKELKEVGQLVLEDYQSFK